MSRSHEWWTSRTMDNPVLLAAKSTLVDELAASSLAGAARDPAARRDWASWFGTLRGAFPKRAVLDAIVRTPDDVVRAAGDYLGKQSQVERFIDQRWAHRDRELPALELAHRRSLERSAESGLPVVVRAFDASTRHWARRLHERGYHVTIEAAPPEEYTAAPVRTRPR